MTAPASLRRLVLWMALLCAGAISASAQPFSVRSEASHFILRVAGIDRPEHVNHLHGFDLSLATADGKPVSGASIVVTGKRRFAPNHLPTSPKVFPGPDAGHYRVEGLRFHMLGDWHLDFAIESGQIRDRAAIDVVVK